MNDRLCIRKHPFESLQYKHGRLNVRQHKTLVKDRVRII